MPSGTKPVSYRGRFAPSPSGPLHLGSLVCALASYLDAKQQHGKWLLRMEDIDPPREEAGAQAEILKSLQAHGLFWDEDVLFQSQRSSAYTQTLHQLSERDLSYRCSCTRKRLIALKGKYDSHCLNTPPSETSPAGIRLKTSTKQYSSLIQFQDRIQRLQSEELQNSCGDFLIHRKDGLFAYQLAVVVDDIKQGITDIVRGDDLLDSTTKQIYLSHVLGAQTPSYAHIPVVVGSDGHKLSKQSHAPAINNDSANCNLVVALNHLGVSTPTALSKESTESILKFGCEHFQLPSK